MNFVVQRTCAALTGILLAHLAGCSSADSGGSGGAISCDTAQEVLPAAPTCDPATRTCRGVVVPADKDACTQCGQTAIAVGLASNSLTECACNHCAVQLSSCFQSATNGEMMGDAVRDKSCQTIVECALRTGCAGTDCYCGANVPAATCIMPSTTPPTGLCAKEIADGAKCAITDRACVTTAVAADSAVSRALAVGQCTTGNPTAMLQGNCPAK
jgi:hypothetical protein